MQLLGAPWSYRIKTFGVDRDYFRFAEMWVFHCKSVERLRGRSLWFEIFVCGRHANFLVARLGKYMRAGKGDLPMDSELKSTLQRLDARLEAGKLIEITRKLFSTWSCFY